MPSKSKKQAKLMSAVAHNPEFAKKVGIPQSVGKDFNDADQVEKSNSIKPVHSTGERYSTYDTVANIGRKMKNTGVEHEGMGPNYKEKPYTTGGRLTAKQQAALDAKPSNVKAKSGPVKTFTDEEKKKMEAMYKPSSQMKKEEMLEIAPDGKQEIVEGKEPLNKDPKKRWKKLKKALDHEKAFMDLEEAMGDDEQDQAEQSGQDHASQMQQELGSEGEQQEQPEQDHADEMQQELSEDGEEQPQQDSGDDQSEAVSGEDGGEEQPQQDSPESGNGEYSDPQELIDALQEEGYSDKEIAYIIHGHHAAEVDPTKAAKAQGISALSDIDVNSAQKMAELEHSHAEQNLAAEREHKKRMSDLEYEKAKRESETSDGSEDDAEINRQIKMLDVEKKRLEVEFHKEEIKLELEFKKREHELKLKMMEAKLREQSKQNQEIGGIKHEQRLAEIKSSLKKPVKESKK